MIEYGVSDGVCILRLNSPPLNTFTLPLIDQLRGGIQRANSDAEVCAIILTGDATHFSAGADINLFKDIESGEHAIRLSRAFQEAFQEVEDSSRPVAAAVAGKVMGSALEIAMACHFRLCTRESTFSMPEVNLGINPGAGGTQRLPRLIGVEAALRMLLTGKPIGAQEALSLGLVDAVCEEAELIEQAKDLLRRCGVPRKTRERRDKVADAKTNEAAFAVADDLLEKANPDVVAPFKIVEAVWTGLEESFEAGLRKEQEVFAECMRTVETQNKIYIFFATRETSKIADLAGVEPTKIARAAVIGMGSMGTGIAHALILGGVPVIVRDESQAILEKGIARITDSVMRAAQDGKISQKRSAEILSLISTTTDWADIAATDLVIEAVFENVDVKRSVIAAVEGVCRPDTIIASNTSTINLDALAEGMRRGDRLIGLHFFNPAHRMPLIEVIRRDATPKHVLATALAFAKRIRKTPVLVKNREGFLVNRLFVPYLKEAFWLLEDGARAPDIDRAMVDFGFAMGPLVLIDMAGIDILVHTDAVMGRVFPMHGRLSATAARLVERGHVGQKTGSGVYKYEKGDYTPHRSETTDALIAEVQAERGLAPREIDAYEITQRLVLRMVNEAFYAMAERIVQRASDVDAAMVLGTGFPDFRGGVFKYAQDIGFDNLLMQLEDLEKQFGERFRPSDLLREMKGAQ